MKRHVAAAALVFASAGVLLAQSGPTPALDGIYSEAQAKRGQALFVENCGACHGAELEGDPYAPPLAGAVFAGKWKDRPLVDLFDLMRVTMPQNFPGGLSRQQNADLLAFMLQKNKVAAGKTDLSPTAPGLQARIAFPATNVLSVAPAAPVHVAVTPVPGLAGRFYTSEQADRGRVQFNKWCTHCHAAAATPTGMSKTGRGFWLGSQHLVLNLGGRYAHKYPSVYHLFRRVRDTMPSFNADAISPATKADIVAYMLERNGFPAGGDELTVDVAKMKTMKLAGSAGEQGFEPVFNGNDFTGLGFMLGPNCRPQPEGCGWTTPNGVFYIKDGAVVTTGKVQGYMYTQKKYLNFTLRFDTRHVRPVDLDEDDEYYDGNSGYLLFVTEHKVWPRAIEVQGNNANMLSSIGMDAVVKEVDDNAARKKAYRRVGEWSSIEMVAKDGQVKSYQNGILVNTIVQHPFNEAGHIGFQSEGVELHWRNIRIKAE